MNRKKRSGFRAALLASLMVGGVTAFGATGGCAAHKNTEIVVGLQTDVRIPKDIDTVELRVLVDGVALVDQPASNENGILSLPGSFGVVAQDPTKPVVIEIVGYVGNTQKVLRRARMTFVDGHTMFLRMPLTFACYGAPDCGDPTLTCVAGECKPIDVDVTKLPEYTSSTQVFGNGGGSDPDSCFDDDMCLPSTSPIAAIGDGCTFMVGGAGADDGGVSVDASASAPDAGSNGGSSGGGGGSGGLPLPNANVAANGPPPFTPVIVVPQAKDVPGWCDASGRCKVPIDHDLEEGWEWTDATQTSFVLANGLCQKMRALGGHLEVTSACGEKTPDRPVCAPTAGQGGGTGGNDASTGTPDTGAHCPSGMVMCASGTCASLQNDPNNCGACGNSCAQFGGTCVNGACSGGTTDAGIGCGSYPMMQCGGACTNANTDPANCGGCGHVCPTGQTCSNGVCSGGAADAGTGCGPFPMVQCPSGCTNVTTDPNNCGGCAKICPTGICQSGVCSTGTDAGTDSGCIPKTCAQLGYNCGTANNGCGGILNCGSCTSPMTCGGKGIPNVCG